MFSSCGRDCPNPNELTQVADRYSVMTMGLMLLLEQTQDATEAITNDVFNNSDDALCYGGLILALHERQTLLKEAAQTYNGGMQNIRNCAQALNCATLRDTTNDTTECFRKTALLEGGESIFELKQFLAHLPPLPSPGLED